MIVEGILSRKTPQLHLWCVRKTNCVLKELLSCNPQLIELILSEQLLGQKFNERVTEFVCRKTEQFNKDISQKQLIAI